MAQCAGCSAKVGCGCRLKDGLCSACQAKLEAKKGKK